MTETKARFIAGNFTTTGAAATIAPGIGGIDSSGVTIIVDSNYVRTRADSAYLENIIDSAYLENIIDSAYVSARSGGGGGAFTIDADNNIISSNSTTTPTAGSGLRNFVAGLQAGANITTGDDNIFIGRSAGYGITTQSGGVALGSYAGYNALYGAGVAIGYQAAYQHPNHSNCVSIGNNAGSLATGGACIHIGGGAGYFNAGIYCIYMGDGAGQSSNTVGNDGDYNIGIGYLSSKAKNAGHNNVMIGKEAGNSNTGASHTGSDNIGIGNRAFGGATGSFYENIMVGYQSGVNMTNGYQNVAIGAAAGASVTTGYRNTLIGRSAGQKSPALTTGNTNIAIGFDNGFNSNAAVQQNVIGTSLVGKGNFTTFIAGPAYQSTNASSWSTTSDERVKKNITNYTIGLDVLNQLNVKTYNYRSDSDIAETYPELADSDGLVHENLPQDKTVVGLIAQELETVLPNSVTTRDNGFKSMDKDEIFWVMLNSIKELKAANDALTVRIEALENA